MFKKKNVIVFVLLAVVCVLFLAACGQSVNNSETAEADKEKPGEAIEMTDHSQYKVALVLPGTINDEGWNATAFQGLELIKQAALDFQRRVGT